MEINMKTVRELLEDPHGIGEKIVRGIIALVFGFIGAAGLFFFVWFFWIIFGS